MEFKNLFYKICSFSQGSRLVRVWVVCFSLDVLPGLQTKQDWEMRTKQNVPTKVRTRITALVYEL